MSTMASGTSANVEDDTTDNSVSSQHKIQALTFNQDCTALSMGTIRHYTLYTINQKKRSDDTYEWDIELDKTRHPLPFEQVRIIERLFSSSLVAIVTRHQPKKLKVFNYRRGSEICSRTYEKPILAVKLNRTRLAVCLEDCIYLHDMQNMTILHKICDIQSQLDGLCALSPNNDAPYLVYPGSGITGEVQVFDMDKLKTTNLISAHNNPVVAMSFDMTGKQIATASNKGTVIRVHNVVDSTIVVEFRRGIMRAATISSLAFSPDSMFLAASSNTETIHIFRLTDPQAQSTGEPSVLAGALNGAWNLLGAILPKPAAEVFMPGRSFATVHVQPGVTKRTIAMRTINQHLTLFVADYNGKVCIYEVNTDEIGTCRQINQYNLFSLLDESIDEKIRQSAASQPINVVPSGGYPPNLIKNQQNVPDHPPVLTNTKDQADQSFDTAIDDSRLSSTPQTDNE